MTTAGTPALPRSRRVRFALVALGILFALALAEIAVRVAAQTRGHPYSAADNELAMWRSVAFIESSRTQGQPRTTRPEEARDDAERSLGLHPYLGFDLRENLEQVRRETEYFQGEESRRACEVMIVGGSVAAGIGNLGAERLAQILTADPIFHGREVRILSHGRGGYKQPQQLLLVAFLLDLGFHPDYVVNVDGFNECALANANIAARVHPSYPSSSHWAHLTSDRQIDRRGLDFLLDLRAKQRQASRLFSWVERLHLHQSALFGKLAVRRVNALKKQFAGIGQGYFRYLTGHPDPAVHGPPIPEDAEAARAMLLETWLQSSRSLDALCRPRGIRYVHVLQPTLHDPGAKPMTPAEVESGECLPSYLEGVQFGYPRMRELGAKLRESGISFVDASHVFRDVHETLYYDVCHFNQAGVKPVVEAIAAAILGRERAGG